LFAGRLLRNQWPPKTLTLILIAMAALLDLLSWPDPDEELPG